MIDWTPILIAGLGIAGTLASPFLSHKLDTLRQKSTNEREDKAALRLKIEETFAEIERLEEVNNRIMVTAIEIGSGKREIKAMERLDLSKIRSNVALYFPECQAALKEFDEQQIRDTYDIREGLKKGEDPVKSMASLIALRSALFLNLVKQMRQEISKVADVAAMRAKAA